MGSSGIERVGLRGAVAGAVEDAEVVAPRADRVAKLVGHDARELMEMREVVDGPGSEELGESDDAEGWVGAAEGELLWAEIEGTEFVEIFGANAGEFVEERGKRFVAKFFGAGFTVERLEGLGFAKLENDFDARHPVGAFAIDEMADDIVGGPGVVAFVAEGPCFGEIAEKRIQGDWRAS